MTASPTAVSSGPKSSTDGGNALAALFAAAAASSMHRQLTTPTTSSLPISSNSRHTKTTAITSRTKLPDNDANNSAAKLLASLLNKPAETATSISSSTTSTTSSSSSSSTGFVEPAVKNKIAQLVAPKSVVKAVVCPEESTIPEHALRNLESWHDEERLDDSCYHELVDSSNQNGWSADDMFKYNEKRHKVTSTYNEKTLAVKYTTPLPKHKSKTTARMASQLASEIGQRVLAEGRITPESSDDDDLFEREQLKRRQFKQQKQLDQLWTLRGNNIMHSTPTKDNNNGHKFSNNHHQSSTRKSNRSSSQYSNSSTTPATASLSSSPTLNDSNTIIKPVTSSSRNILRTCLS